ncbi:MAG TPA: hypothetical protein VEL82_05725 [Thermoplasmata archaeon]|nr:hypothetical protein [Thermoplasmata archaeon]
MTGTSESGGIPRPLRARWRIAAAAVATAVLVIVAVAVLLPAGKPANRGTGVPTPNGEIPLLPSPGTQSACITGTPGVPRPTLPLQEGVLQANTYNVPSGTIGHVGMCYGAESGEMYAYANWSHVGSAGGWFSYPQITYGVNAWLGADSTYTNQSSSWELPQTVGAVTGENVWFTTHYSFSAPATADVDGYDLSLDEFLTESLPPVFEVGPFVEVELFLAHNISYPFQWIHWETPTLVNSTLALEPWDVGYYCHGADNSSNANISFDFSYGGQATHGLAAGELGVNLSAVLSEVESLMPGTSCWTGPTDGFGAFHWDEANLGSEDGALGNADFSYDWTIEQYCIHVIEGAAASTELGCT